MRRRRRDESDPLRSIVEVGQTASSFIPGKMGYGVDGVTRVLGEQYAVGDEIDALAAAGMHPRILRHSFSRAARLKLKSLENRPADAFKKWGVQALAWAGGGVIGAMVLGPILPFGTLIGGVAGGAGMGYVAGQLYEGVCEKTEQDAVKLAADCYCTHRDHGIIDREKAFAALVAALPEKMQKKYEDMLEKKAGTRDFAQAVQTREGLNALHQMMNDPYLEELLRGSHIPPNPQVPDQHVADQYAELINHGKLDARAIILDPDSVRDIAERYYLQGMVHKNVLPQEDDHVMLQQQLPAAGPRANGKNYI